MFDKQRYKLWAVVGGYECDFALKRKAIALGEQRMRVAFNYSHVLVACMSLGPSYVANSVILGGWRPL